jgi:hypothetical protein
LKLCFTDTRINQSWSTLSLTDFIVAHPSKMTSQINLNENR